MENTGINLLKNVPFLTKDNYKSVLPYQNEGANEAYFGDLQKCVSILKEKYSGDVNGLWFIRVPSVDGGVQVIYRTKEAFELKKRLQLASDVFDFTCHEMKYAITNDSIEGLRSVPIDEWLADGHVFAVYDSERE